MSAETQGAKQVLALAKRLDDQQIQWAVPATAVFDLETPAQRMESGGIFAYVVGGLHYFRRTLMKVVHEVLPASDMTGMEKALGRFADGEQEMVIFTRHTSPPWAVFGDGADSHRFLMNKLSEQ